MNQISFREFFREKYFKVDRKYVDISMPKNVLSEMAERLDVAKRPVKLDQDDIGFLQQFPSQFWSQALHQRYYTDLKEGLKERQERRKPIEKNLQKILYKALFESNYDILQNKISDDLFNKLKNKHQYDHVQGDKKMAEMAAIGLAEKETEKQVPHVNYPPQEEGIPPGYKTYVFKKSRHGQDEIEIAAKPYINRLVHKLERNRDMEHHPESGLHELGTTHGQYGYDLYDIKEGDDNIPHTTRGMQLPPQEEVSERLSAFLNHNGHGMYGELPTGPDIIWKPVGDGRTIYKDNWSWRKIYNKLFSQWFMKLSTAEPGSYKLPDGTKIPPEKGFVLRSQLRAAAHKMAMAEVIEKAEFGTITGPPIPGIAPNGLPVKVKVVDGEKKIDAPPLYLPHKRMSVRVRGPYGTTTQQEDIPLVNPAQYLREVGTKEDDDKLDATELRGYNKDYIHVPHGEYKKAPGYLAGGALHVTQNTPGRQYLDPSDPAYQERRDEIENEMGMTALNDFNEPIKVKEANQKTFFYDIIKGIWNCIKSACGGMTNHEVQIMKDNIPDLHQMVFQKLMMNLRDEKMDTRRGRRAFARNVVSSWAQQDLGQGGGTRRLRRLTQAARNLSLQQQTAAGGTVGAGVEEKDRPSESLLDNIKRKQGEKYRPVGQHQFSYHVDNLNKIISELEGQAQKVDDERDKAITLSYQQISDSIADLIGNAVTDKAAFIFELQYYIKELYRAAGMKDNEAESMAQQKIAEYTAGGKKAKQIIAAFKKDEHIQQILNQAGDGSGLSLAAQDALQRLRDILDELPADKLSDPTTQNMIYQYIDNNVDVEARPILKAEADKAFGKVVTPVVKQQPQKPQATSQQEKYIQEANSLITQKKWLELSSHPYFLHVATPKMLTSLIGKLQTAMQGFAKDSFDYENHEFSIAHLESILKKRQQTTGIMDIE